MISPVQAPNLPDRPDRFRPDPTFALRITVIDPSRCGAIADVELEVPVGTPVDALRRRLRTAVGAGPEPPGSAGFYLDGAPVAGVLGEPPLLNGAVLVLGRPGGVRGRAAGTAGGLLEVHVVAGPDCGGRFPLPAGGTRIGTAAEADLRLADPGLAPLQAELRNERGRMSVRDLGRPGGCRLDGRPLGATAEPVEPGRPVQLGDCVLVVRPADGAWAAGGGPADARPDGRGRLLVRPPRQRDHRRDDPPDLATVAACAAGPLERLWAGRSGPLRLRLGRTVPDGAAKVLRLPAPAALDLVGDRPAALALARSLIGQAAVRHGPGELGIVVQDHRPGRSGSDWDWTRWLPHTDRTGAPRTLVVTDDHLLTLRLLGGPGGPEPLHRPAAMVDLDGARAVLFPDLGAPQELRPDLVGAGWAERLGRDLARLGQAPDPPP